jgi:periplasmic mercuric ion binding protein
MKTIITLALIGLATSFAAAESQVTLTGLHNCCASCAKGIEKAVATVKDATVKLDGKTANITVKRPSDSKKVVEAIMDAGYYGKTEGAPSEAPATAGAAKVKSASVTNVHMCCGKCVTAATKAVTSVAGVTGNTIKNKVTSFEVTGEFDVAALGKALNDAGFNGKIK